MPSIWAPLKGLVNTIGGVDFDINIDFDLNGRKYKKGVQHMDGQAVLDYLRVRKEGNIDESGEDGDLNRIDRQKRMLVAIFEKIKSSDLLAQLPGILDTFQGNLYTNTSFAQTAALAWYMKNVDSANIKMNSMEGTYDKLFFELRFVFTNQSKRIALIKQVYGKEDVQAESKYTHGVAVNRWASMRKSVVIKKAQGVLSKAKEKLEADAALPEYVPPTDGSPVPSTTPKGYKKYASSVHTLYEKAAGECNSLESKDGQALFDAEEQLIADIGKLCGKLGITEPSYGVSSSGYNEIDVDPR